MDMNERMEVLRRRCLDSTMPRPWRLGVSAEAESLRRSEGEPWEVRCGLRTRDRLAAARFEVDDLELLVGRYLPPAEEPSDEDREVLDQYYRPGGQTGHCEIDLSEALSDGLGALRQRLQGLEDAASGARRDAYRSFGLAVDGLQAMIVNAADSVQEALARTDSAERKAELRTMLESVRRVQSDAPQTFRDAIQLMWLINMAAMYGDCIGLVGPGHIDRSLAAFYERDLDRGVLTREEALALIESLYILYNCLVSRGGAIAVMVGGRDADGRDVTNDLSYLCLEALRRTRLTYPTVGICWHEGTPEDLSRLAVDIIAEGIPNPAFFGDETIQRGLARYGMPAEERHHYINSTCVEITPVGSSNVWVASPYFSLCQMLLEEIGDQACSGADGSFEEFLESYLERVRTEIEVQVADRNEARRERMRRGGKPLQSVFTRDCIARGVDIDRGGARYNWVECSFVGLANLADSLHVLREECFGEGGTSLAELHQMLEVDFEGYEQQRLHLLNDYAKYGQGADEVDALVETVTGRLAEFCEGHSMEPDGSPFVPGAFVWVKHEQLGGQCGATPDGRRAGTPFADGAGPAQGRETAGPTAAILSTTAWDHSAYIGGVAMNMKFPKKLLGSAAEREKFRHMVTTYLARGGFEVQVNVLDADVLKKARANPEQYADLVVRIGGYTDYFTALSEGMQEELIARTEYAAV
jgi:formate C-acetyltransferase